MTSILRGILKIPFIRSVKDFLFYTPMPFGLKYTYGTLYGWNWHEARTNPEPETVAFFIKNIKPNDIVADIGSNIGYFALQFSHLVGDGGKVIAFEPSPRAYARLKKAVRGKKNVTPINKGIFSEKKTLSLYSKRPGHAMASIMYEAGTSKTTVDVIPLKEYPLEFNWAKIDVEGAELEVLRGMRKPIRCILEVAKGILSEHGTGVEHFFQQIENMGYRIYFIVNNGEIVEWTGNNIQELMNNIYIEPKV